MGGYKPWQSAMSAGCVKTLTKNRNERVYAKSEIYRLVISVKFYLWTQFLALFLIVSATKKVFTQPERTLCLNANSRLPHASGGVLHLLRIYGVW